MDGRFLLGGGPAGEGTDVLRGVEVVVADRVTPGRVGPDEGGVHEEGLVAVLLEVVDHGRADERRLRELHREAGRRPGRAVLVGPGEALHRLVEIVRVGRHVEPPGGQPASPGRGVLFPGVLDQWPEPGQHALVAEEARIAGRDRARIDRGVGVAEEDRVVPHVPGDQSDVGEASVERGAVEQRTVPVLIRPGVEAGPRRAAGRGVGPVVGEEHAAAGQRVERGRLQQWVAQRGQAVAPPLVEGDEEHVAGGRHGATLADGGRSSVPICRCRSCRCRSPVPMGRCRWRRVRRCKCAGRRQGGESGCVRDAGRPTRGSGAAGRMAGRPAAPGLTRSGWTLLRDGSRSR